MKEQLSEKSKRQADDLMEQIRKNPPRVKSISEVVNLLHVISAEQRSCNILRSCVDKVLMNMSNIRTLRDIIERLRSVSRTNGFRFELPTSASPETRCQLVSDMFSMKIVLGTSSTPDHSPTVLDVSIKHKDDYRSSPHLANVIRAGNFLELSNHLKGLMEMYSTSGSRQSRTRVYLALQSLETDLVKMSHMYRETHKDATVLDVAMKGTLGFLTPRLAGDRPHFAYYVSPYDLVDTAANCKITLKDNVPRNVGLHAEVSIEQRNSSCTLPISPLITNKHPIDKSGMPRLMDISHHNSTSVQACFVLHLKPPVPVLSKVADDILKITNLELRSESGKKKKYLELLCAEENTFKVFMGGEPHVYYLDLSDLQGTLVNKVYFTHPGHVVRILELLRKQAHLNTLISSCIRDFGKASKTGKEWYFEVSCNKDIDKVNVMMEHPSAKGTASLEIKLDKDGFVGCKIFTGRGDPPLCSDEFVVRILRNCSSLPITMRKLIEQSIKNPKKESDVNRTRPPALFAPPPATRQPPPNILTPVPRPLLPHQPPPQQPSSAMGFGGMGTSTFPFTPVSESPKSSIMPKKCADNPMLTQLLIPKATDSSEIMEPADQPIRSHPMLLTLLKDDSDQDSQVPQSRGSKPTSTVPITSNQSSGLMGGSQQLQFNTPSSLSIGFMSPNSTYPNLEPPIPIPTSFPMPPPSYPSHSQNQFNPPMQLPSMSPQVPHSPYSSQPSPMGGMDDNMGPVTPTLSFGMMSPGLISPSLSQTLTKGRRTSRQKSQSMENNDFSGFDVSQYESQMSVESANSLSEILGIPNKTGTMPLRRTESMSPGGAVAPHHMPLQHSSSLKSISGSGMNANLLTRSISASSGKSPRSMTSPGQRNLRTPDPLTALSSPPDVPNVNQRGTRVKSYDSHTSELFRSPLPSASPGGLGSLNLLSMSAGSLQDPDTDPFTFDDNKNPSNISVSENVSTPVARSGKPLPPISSGPIDNSDALKEFAKTKPVLFRALTGDAPPIKTEVPSTLQRQLGTAGPGLMASLSSNTTTPSASSIGTFDFPNKQMTSTTITTISERSLVRQNALDKPTASGAQNKSGDVKSEKAVKRRNSNKNDEGKPVAKKRGRPPTVNHHGGKRKKGDPVGGSNDDSGSNPSIMLNIQLSSTGAPISSTTKTKPLVGSASTPPHKNPSGGVSSATAGASSNAANPSGGNIGSVAATGNFAFLSQYLKSQEERQQKMKGMKEKKGTGKTSSKPSFNQSSVTGGAISTEKSQLGTQAGKPGSSPRSGSVLPAQRKRKASIKDIADKLHSKASETSTTPRPSSPDKTNAEKDVVKKSVLLGGLSKAGITVKGIGDERALKGTLAPKLTKIPMPKMTQGAAAKQSGVFVPVGSAKSGRLSAETLLNRKSGDDMVQVLKNIKEAADATTKRKTPLSKPATVKAARPSVSGKARSATPTSVTSSVTQVQRKSPSSQMLKTLPDVSGRTMPLKMASSSGSVSPQIVKKSPLRNSGLPSRPSSSSSIESSSSAGKQSSTSPATAMITLPRKASHSTSSFAGDQRFVAPSISQTPKRTTSPQIPRTTSPLTRVEDMHGKGLPGRSPHRPSPTNSRISTPVPAASPQSPDDRLMIVDDSVPNTNVQPATRDEQKPVFIPGKRFSERLSPERTAMPSPLSPPPLSQKSSTSSLLQATTKRAPTPRSNIASPGMSPANYSPFSVDDDLMNQAVTG